MKYYYRKHLYLQKRDLVYLKKIGYKWSELVKYGSDNSLNLNDFIMISSVDYNNEMFKEIIDYNILSEMNLIEVINWFEQLFQKESKIVKIKYLLESYQFIIELLVKKEQLNLPIFPDGNFYFSDMSYGISLMSSNLSDCFMLRFNDNHLILTKLDQQYLAELLNCKIYDRLGFMINPDSLVVEKDLNNGFCLLKIAKVKKDNNRLNLLHKKISI